MINNPILTRSVRNAVLMYAYVWLVAGFMNTAGKYISGPDTIVTGVTMLMLLVVSASITALLVLGEPVKLYLDGKKHESVKQLVTTIATLAVLTIATMALLFTLSR